MPKLKNVTLEELHAAAEAAQDAGQLASHIAQRAEQGYLDEVPEPIQRASAFMGAAAALNEVARMLILKATLQEQRRELEERLRAKK
jgi:hypothetical protein